MELAHTRRALLRSDELDVQAKSESKHKIKDRQKPILYFGAQFGKKVEPLWLLITN